MSTLEGYSGYGAEQGEKVCFYRHYLLICSAALDFVLPKLLFSTILKTSISRLEPLSLVLAYLSLCNLLGSDRSFNIQSCSLKIFYPCVPFTFLIGLNPSIS